MGLSNKDKTTRQTRINGKVVEYNECLSGMTSKEAIKKQAKQAFSHYLGSSYYWRVDFGKWFEDKKINHFFSRPPTKVKIQKARKAPRSKYSHPS